MSSLEKFNRGQKRKKTATRMLIVLAILVVFCLIVFDYIPDVNNGQYGKDGQLEQLQNAFGGKECAANQPLLVIETESDSLQEGKIVCTKKGGSHWFAALYTQSDRLNPSNDQTWQDIREIDPEQFSLSYHPRNDSQMEQYVQILTATDDGYANIEDEGSSFSQKTMNKGGINQVRNACGHSFLTRVANERPCNK